MSSDNAEKDKDKDTKSVQNLLLDFPPPPQVALIESDCPELGSSLIRDLKILTRLTVTFKDNNFLPILNNSRNAKGYDLLALSPTSTNALVNILKAGFRADLICFDQDSTKVREILFSLVLL